MSQYYYIDRNYKGPTVVQGNLKKAKKEKAMSRLLSLYNTRYFYLDLRAVRFYYISGPNKTKDVSFEDIKNVQPGSSVPGMLPTDFKLSFTICTKKRDYYFVAENEEMRLNFMRGFAALIPLYHDERLINFREFPQWEQFLLPKESIAGGKQELTDTSAEKPKKKISATQEDGEKGEETKVEKSHTKRAPVEERSLLVNDVHKKTVINIMDAPKITEKKPKAQPVEEPVMEFRRIKQDRSLLDNQINETQKLNADVEAFKELNRDEQPKEEKPADEVKEVEPEQEKPNEKGAPPIETDHHEIHEEVPPPQPVIIVKANEETKSNPATEKWTKARKDSDEPVEKVSEPVEEVEEEIISPGKIKKMPTVPTRFRAKTPERDEEEEAPPRKGRDDEDEEPERRNETPPRFEEKKPAFNHDDDEDDDLPPPKPKNEYKPAPQVSKKQEKENHDEWDEPDNDFNSKNTTKTTTTANQPVNKKPNYDDWDSPVKVTKGSEPKKAAPKAQPVKNYDDWDDEFEQDAKKGAQAKPAPAPSKAKEAPKQQVKQNYDDWDD